MKIKTLYYGEIEIKEESILTFESGVPGFQDEKRFTLIKLPENSTFQILQSIKTPELSFAITNPYIFYREYEFQLDEGTKEQLGIDHNEDVSVFCIVTLQETIEKSSLNLQAPVVSNMKNNKAKQIILNDKRYKTKHPLYQESEGKVHVSTNEKNR
ncbi:flagellar assembly protein FliW [Salirhabdus sp. Marseille-P4669]|uniref:flagellar assembly protein FliW n=1 Tax=Salirhabdus sp. Marseille-P4669 TaxID=2042310 RepID=UPI000C7A1FB7|nr:flagellar assembly protein FliW [Salirhabdus sp. Marseille-P4669]